MSEDLAIKGVRDSLVVTLPEEDDSPILSRLYRAIETRPQFFRGARVALDVGSRQVDRGELEYLLDGLAQREITLFALLSTDETTKRAAADLGLDLHLDRAAHDEGIHQPAFDTQLSGENAVLIERTLRSGNQVRFAGHVIVMGDVNPGAEIICGGNIIVWGRLRGVVHAGAGGDEAAIVCALEFSPPQLRIGGTIALSPEKEGPSLPEVARVKGDQIVVEPWDHTR
jgi:septum site-determining protein MinC